MDLRVRRKRYGRATVGVGLSGIFLEEHTSLGQTLFVASGIIGTQPEVYVNGVLQSQASFIVVDNYRINFLTTVPAGSIVTMKVLGGNNLTYVPTDFPGLQWWYAPRLETIYIENQQVNNLSDKSGNLQNCTRPLDIFCPLYKTNILNQKCLQWDGSNDILSNANASPRNDGNFLHEGDFTYIALINPTDLTQVSYLLDTINASNTAKGIYIRLENPGRITVRINNGVTSIYSLITGSNVVSANQWQVLVVRNNANDPSNLQVYLNNILVSQANPSAAYIAGSPANGFTVHGNRLAASEAWTGYTSDLIAYNRALSDEELTRLLGGLSFN